jgi:hypothetical protein
MGKLGSCFATINLSTRLPIKLCDPEVSLVARPAAANRIGDPLSFLSHLATPVEAEAETTQIVLGVVVKVEGVEGAAEAGFQIAEQVVDPAGPIREVVRSGC